MKTPSIDILDGHLTISSWFLRTLVVFKHHCFEVVLQNLTKKINLWNLPWFQLRLKEKEINIEGEF